MSTLASSSVFTEYCGEFAKAARQGPSIYFAPIRGAVLGVLSQWKRSNEVSARKLRKQQ